VAVRQITLHRRRKIRRVGEERAGINPLLSRVAYRAGAEHMDIEMSQSIRGIDQQGMVRIRDEGFPREPATRIERRAILHQVSLITTDKPSLLIRWT
jgi:hypothetical protein